MVFWTASFSRKRWLLRWAISFVASVFVISAFVSSAHAEYRVFELVITDTVTQAKRTVLSTLDDLQYPTYFHLTKSQTIAIQDTWMCWQRSDVSQDLDQRYCENPRKNTRANGSARIPASSTNP